GGLTINGTHERMRPDLRVHVAATGVEFLKNADFSNTAMPEGFPDALLGTVKQFMEQYVTQIQTFVKETEVAPGVSAELTGGHTPGHCMVRLTSDGERLTFVGDAIFQTGFDKPGWHNGFEHDPEEAARVRVNLLREFAETREPFVATHLPFPSIYHVAVSGDAFRAVPAVWDY